MESCSWLWSPIASRRCHLHHTTINTHSDLNTDRTWWESANYILYHISGKLFYWCYLCELFYHRVYESFMQYSTYTFEKKVWNFAIMCSMHCCTAFQTGKVRGQNAAFISNVGPRVSLPANYCFMFAGFQETAVWFSQQSIDHCQNHAHKRLVFGMAYSSEQSKVSHSQVVVQGGRAWYTMFACVPISLGNLHTTLLHWNYGQYLFSCWKGVLPVRHIRAVLKSETISLWQ